MKANLSVSVIIRLEIRNVLNVYVNDLIKPKIFIILNYISNRIN